MQNYQFICCYFVVVVEVHTKNIVLRQFEVIFSQMWWSGWKGLTFSSFDADLKIKHKTDKITHDLSIKHNCPRKAMQEKEFKMVVQHKLKIPLLLLAKLASPVILNS